MDRYGRCKSSMLNTVTDYPGEVHLELACGARVDIDDCQVKNVTLGQPGVGNCTYHVRIQCMEPGTKYGV